MFENLIFTVASAKKKKSLLLSGLSKSSLKKIIFLQRFLLLRLLLHFILEQALIFRDEIKIFIKNTPQKQADLKFTN